MPRSDGGEPVLVPGNPVKLSKMTEGPETRVPWLGEHTDEVLTAELGVSAERLAELRARGIIG
jgi:crotonobetainyl-CoA:carnitine CoA-transferase CaiB-like acyl-CoA transferase